MQSENIMRTLKEHYSLLFTHMEFMRAGGTKTFIVHSTGEKYLLKLIPSVFMDTIRHSFDVILFLSENDFPVPRIILTQDGQPYCNYEDDGEFYLCVLFLFIEGREPELGEGIEEIGTLVAQLHNVMEKYTGALLARDKHFFIGRYLDILTRKEYDKYKIQFYRDYGDALWERVKNLPQGFCHGDLFRGNLLRTSLGEFYILDFDTACRAFPVYDIMVMCDSTDYFKFEQAGFVKTQKIYERFLTGYLPQRNLSNLEVKAFYDLVAVRHYQLQATIIEIHGLDCIDHSFIDKQMSWLMQWREMADTGRIC